MKRSIKTIISAVLTCTMLLPVSAFAAEFSDMPNNWTTGALERAVKNGLLNGADGKIMPDDNITRAQMAAIIVRALGADQEADISEFVDVSKDKWYYSEFARAVQMEAFKGDGNKLNPDNFITFEECFTVVSRVFDLRENDPDCLQKFDDYSKVAEWAKPYMVTVVGNGYWEGIDNKLKPKDYITRSEFAVLMDNLVKTYINEPGTYTNFDKGNILIRSEGVTIDGLETSDLIIVGDGVHEKTNLLNLKSKGIIVVRGGTAVLTGSINNLCSPASNVKLDISGLEERTGWIKMSDDSVLFIGTFLPHK